MLQVKIGLRPVINKVLKQKKTQNGVDTVYETSDGFVYETSDGFIYSLAKNLN